MFNKGGFGGGFGQQAQPANSVFGQPQQQQTPGFGGFGANAGTPSAFGGAAAPATGAFGQPAQPSGFGAPAANAGAFGAPVSNAFGQPRPSGFGSSNAFGAAQPAASSGFGGFGATSSTPAFGTPQAGQAAGGIFGQRPATTGAFGAAAPATNNVFGAQPQQTSSFGAMSTSTSGFGQTSNTVGGQNGTALADFAPTQDRDVATNTNNFFQTITAMPQYKNFSVEELRLQDYMNNRKTSTAAPSGFGTPAATGFGQQPSSSGFGAASGGIFGQPQQPAATNAFGQPATTNAFGGGGFGQPAAAAPAFGAGAGGFGQPAATTTGFGANAGAFGQAAKPFSFGTPATSTAQPAATGFGQPAATGFGQPAATGFGQPAATGFGQPAATGFGQPAATGFGGGFGAKPATSAAPATGFGGGFGGGFGQPAAAKPATGFSFGNTATSQPAASTGFGGGFGQPAAGGLGFGASQAPQAGGIFGAKSAAPTTSIFGNPQANATPSFGFGQQAQQPTTGFGAGSNLFGQQPAASSAPGTGIFGSTGLGGSTGFGGFGNTQQQGLGTGAFSMPTQGGLTSFGTNPLQPGQQQQFLVAQVDKDPYGKNPLFDVKTQGTGSTGYSAIPVNNSQTKKQPARHYPMTPRTVSRIKLRGFSFAPPVKTSATKMSSLEGISDEDILRSGAFAPFPTNRKNVFDKSIDNDTISTLLNQTSEKPKPLFNPDLEYLAESELKEAKEAAHKPAVTSTPIITTPAEPASPALSTAATIQGYYCSPNLEALQTMSEDDLKHVENFVVGRRGYGEVKFDVPVDLSKTDLHNIMGNIVIISKKKLILYSNTPTPPIGKELNVPATCKIQEVYATDKDTGNPIKDPNHPKTKSFVAKLQKQPRTTFVNYDLSSGTWTFKVENFEE
ncbi:nucleoporin autopeptidase-domain-containing protein [Phycomyces nitens]|nr:nucleoporin autopeptidase-domain-containing protein [Phycomyces nitens]